MTKGNTSNERGTGRIELKYPLLRHDATDFPVWHQQRKGSMGSYPPWLPAPPLGLPKLEHRILESRTSIIFTSLSPALRLSDPVLVMGEELGNTERNCRWQQKGKV